MKKTLPKKKLVVSHMTIGILTEPNLVAIAGGLPDSDSTDSIVSNKPKTCSGKTFTC